MVLYIRPLILLPLSIIEYRLQSAPQGLHLLQDYLAEHHLNRHLTEIVLQSDRLKLAGKITHICVFIILHTCIGCIRVFSFDG